MHVKDPNKALLEIYVSKARDAAAFSLLVFRESDGIL